jgi:putative ABC transport system permease protein
LDPALKERNQRDVLRLQPLHDIHLTSHLAEEPEPNGDERIATFLGIIGIFVLTIAWINYVNLSTAKAMERANEVGVGKVMGAYRGQLVWQFLSEAGLTNLASVILSVIIVALVLPSFNSL